jgi:hypothetical protein
MLALAPCSSCCSHGSGHNGRLFRYYFFLVGKHKPHCTLRTLRQCEKSKKKQKQTSLFVYRQHAVELSCLEMRLWLMEGGNHARVRCSSGLSFNLPRFFFFFGEGKVLRVLSKEASSLAEKRKKKG